MEGKNIHLIGISGVGMSSVALLLKEKGNNITGSDEGNYPPSSTLLEQKNIPCSTPYNPSNIPKNVDIIVIGKNKRLTLEKNKEVQKAHSMGVPVLSFPEVLNSLTKKTKNIVCAGSSGKTTCACLMAWCLTKAKKNPSFFTGGIIKNLNTSAQIGDSDIFVLEGDEYPTSNEDSKPKFLYYNPTDVLITSLLHDHLDIFPTKEDYNKVFIDLVHSIKKGGKCVINSSQRETKVLLDIPNVEKITYGLENAKWTATEINHKDTTTFTLNCSGNKVVDLETSLIGNHNIENIVGVSALLLENEYISKEELADAVKDFGGVKNRLEKINKTNDIMVYEGFGSSSEKIRSAIDALYLHKKSRIIVVFEPHSTSLKMKEYLPFYKDLFKKADRVYIYTPTLNKGVVTLDDIMDASDTKLIPIDNVNDGIEKMQKEIKLGDIILTLSSGDIGGLRDEIVRLVDE